MSAHELAARLLAVRDGAPPLENLPPELEPRELAHAYRVADSMVAALARRYGGVAGYKVGATSSSGQALLGLAEPFYGRTFRPWVLADGAQWRLGGRAFTVEPEIGFRVAIDLPPRAAEYSMLELRAAIGEVMPLLEINLPAFARPLEAGGLCLIADNGVTQGFVLGAPRAGLEAVADLSGEAVELSRNGTISVTGSGNAVLGNPVNAVLWLANTLRVQGYGLRAGDVVASGAMSPHVPLARGDRVVARYSTIGEVRLRATG